MIEQDNNINLLVSIRYIQANKKVKVVAIVLMS